MCVCVWRGGGWGGWLALKLFSLDFIIHVSCMVAPGDGSGGPGLIRGGRVQLAKFLRNLLPPPHTSPPHTSPPPAGRSTFISARLFLLQTRQTNMLISTDGF